MNSSLLGVLPYSKFQKIKKLKLITYDRPMVGCFCDLQVLFGKEVFKLYQKYPIFNCNSNF